MRAALLILAVVVVGWCYHEATKTPEGPTVIDTARPAGPSDSDLRVAAQMAVEANLRDPGSAEFRNVVVVRGDSSTAVCGEVNAKNGFGGYTGYTSFVAIGRLVQIQTRRDDGFTTLWNAACVAQRGKWDRVEPPANGDPVPR